MSNYQRVFGDVLSCRKNKPTYSWYGGFVNAMRSFAWNPSKSYHSRSWGTFQPLLCPWLQQCLAVCLQLSVVTCTKVSLVPDHEFRTRSVCPDSVRSPTVQEVLVSWVLNLGRYRFISVRTSPIYCIGVIPVSITNISPIYWRTISLF